MNTTYALNQAAERVYKTEPLYIGLSSTEPGIDGGGVTEPTTAGNGYTRVLLSPLGDAVDGVISNTANIEMERLMADSGTAEWYVIYDAQAVGSGHLLHYGKLDQLRHLEKNSQIIFETGMLKLSAVNGPEASA